jgi:hypothetical protein
VSEESFLSDDFLRQLIGVGGVDLMVCVPSHNDVKTIVPVLRAIGSPAEGQHARQGERI